MSRLTGIGAVVGMLACAAFVAAQAVPERLMTVKEDGRPSRQCRVLKAWKDKDGNKISKVQALDNGEMLTVIQTDNSLGYSGTSRGGSSMKVLHHGGESKPTAPVVVAAPPSRPRTPTSVVVTKPAPMPRPMPAPVVEAPPVMRVEASVTPPLPPAPTKERWGQTERIPSDTKPGIVKAQATIEMKPQVKPAMMVERPVAPTYVAPPPPPVVETVVSAPMVVNERPRGGLLGGRLRPERTEVVVESHPTMPPSAMPVTEGPRGGLLASRERGDDEPSAWAKMTGVRRTVPSPLMKPGTGMASMEAAATTPGAAPMPLPPSRPSAMAAAHSFPAPMQRGQPMMVSQAGVPDGMGNAFTKAGSSRPIPTDMARVPYVQNGLQAGNMGGAEGRPVFPPHAMAMAQPMPYPAPAAMVPMPMPVLAPKPAPAVAQAPSAVKALRDSLMPSEREMAAEQLGQGKSSREVIDALLSCAKGDPAGSVRAACVRSLAKLKANSPPVITAVSALKDDSDIRVRQEVEQAMHVLSK